MTARVYLDTNIFIRAFEGTDDLSRALIELFATEAAQPFLATSELTLAELLVHPYRNHDDIARERYESPLRSSAWLQVGSVDRDVLVGASLLRSKYKLKLPDAIHASTALHLGCSLLLTDDGGLTGKFDFSYRSTGRHWPQQAVETVPLDLASMALAAGQLRA